MFSDLQRHGFDGYTQKKEKIKNAHIPGAVGLKNEIDFV